MYISVLIDVIIRIYFFAMGSKNSKNTSFTEISLEEHYLKMQSCSKVDFEINFAYGYKK